MGRAVTPVSRGRGPGGQAQAGEGDPGLEQLAKFFPIETGGPYLALSTLAVQSTDSQTSDRRTLLFVIFGVLAFATLILLMRQYSSSAYLHRWVPILIGLFAFVTWAYASGALAQEIKIYNRGFALVLPVLYASVAILYKPVKRE